MKGDAGPSTEDPRGEIATLMRRLHETQKRLHELTGGDSDAGSAPGMQSVAPGEAQENLRRSEGARHDLAPMQSAILDAIPEHVAVIDRMGVILSLNAAWQQFAAGNAPDPSSSGLGQNYVEVCERAQGDGGADARAAAAGIRAILSGASTAEFLLEYPCHSPTEERWFLLRANPIGKDGPGGAVIMHVNITEHKKLENAARENDERFSSIFTTSTTGMAISTPHGRFLQVNPAYCKMLGYTEEELLQRDFASLTHPDDLTLNLKLRDELLAGQRESFVLEKRYFKKNGDIVWTRQSVSAAHGAHGEIVTLMAVAEDITERTQAVSERRWADEALVASELQYRELVGALPAAVFTCDAEGRITLFNDAAVKLWGRVPDTVMDRWSGAWRLYASNGAPLPFEDSPSAMAVRGGRSIHGVEIIVERPDGSRSHVVRHVDPLRDSAGRVVGTVNMQFDLTERRRGEEALRRSGEELRALAQRIESIREEQVVRIARELHDDLGQALTMLKILVLSQQRQLERYTGEPATTQSREALELIRGALRSVRELCAELRPPVLDLLGLGPAIETLAAQFRTRTGIPCAVSGAADLPAMEMQSQLAAYRIVQELLTNVARHAQASEVHIALRVKGGTLEIEVADNGRGIRAGEAAGIRSLGLLGIRERALAAGGSIAIEGQATGGTVGTMRIPIVQQRETP